MALHSPFDKERMCLASAKKASNRRSALKEVADSANPVVSRTFFNDRYSKRSLFVDGAFCLTTQQLRNGKVARQLLIT